MPTITLTQEQADELVWFAGNAAYHYGVLAGRADGHIDKDYYTAASKALRGLVELLASEETARAKD